MSALFRWIEINYGLFPAFGVVGSLLLLTAVICAAVATARLRRPPPRFPSLNSRLRVAIKSNPVKPNQIEAARDAAEAILLTPSAPTSRRKPRPPRAAAYGRWDNRKVQAGLIVTASLLGWAALRRRQVRRAVV